MKNWGFESPGFKIYMRFTVIFSEIIFFYIPLFLLIKIISFRKENKYTNYFSHLALILFNPVFILIDHGHFQYNCVMLGLFLYALYFCFKKYYYLTIIFFLLSINFKQMGLYYALVFFFFFIREIVKEAKGYSFIQTVFHLLRSVIVYGAFSIMVMLIIWLPWFKNYMHVITRIFPVWRGIFEDKVALSLYLGSEFLVHFECFLQIAKYTKKLFDYWISRIYFIVKSTKSSITFILQF